MGVSREAYMAWVQQQAKGRFERVHGEIVPMSPELIAHARLKAAIWLALHTAIEAAGLSTFEALPDGVTVQAGDGSDYEPDVVVAGGEPVPGNSIAVPTPVIVVEVLSRRTAKVDTTQKLIDYFTISSVVHYLVASVDQQKIVHHHRLDDARIMTAIVTEGDIDLDPPGIKLAIAPLYRRII